MPIIDDYATPQLQKPVDQNDHYLGPTDAPVTLVEYGDYECPYCGQAYDVLNRILDAMGSQLCYVFRNFPLTQIHPHAMQAALAAEGAGAQGNFWEMHDTLYENQQNLEMDDLVSYAAKLNLNQERFIADITEGRHADRIRKDFLGGVKSGVNGTPSFFINGFRYEGSWDFDSLFAALETAREESLAYGQRRIA